MTRSDAFREMICAAGPGGLFINRRDLANKLGCSLTTLARIRRRLTAAGDIVQTPIFDEFDGCRGLRFDLVDKAA